MRKIIPYNKNGSEYCYHAGKVAEGKHCRRTSVIVIWRERQQHNFFLARRWRRWNEGN